MVGFLAEVRHKFYTQKEDPGIYFKTTWIQNNYFVWIWFLTLCLFGDRSFSTTFCGGNHHEKKIAS